MALRAVVAGTVVAGIAAAGVATGREKAPPDGPWRPHRLERCADRVANDLAVQAALDEAAGHHARGNGSDAFAQLEDCLREHGEAPDLLLTLGQLYLLAALGRESVVPRAGPAARTGEWARDRGAWLNRAETLLAAAGRLRPDDAVVDYLLAEVARERGDLETAMATELRAMRKCTCTESFEIVRRDQGVRDFPAQVTSQIVPLYPQEARARRRQGRVVLDLLLDPEGRVAQVETVAGDPVLATAAAAAAVDAGYQAARVGLYPIWSWLRVTIDFRLRGSE
jgi:TonB family protein